MEYLLRAWQLSDNKMATAPMNIGHVYLLQQNSQQAIEWYKKSISLWDDVSTFFKEMEEDYIELKMEERGVSKENYTQIIEILQKQ